MPPEPEIDEAAEELGVAPAELEEILQDVQQTLEDLAEMDVDISEPADLERVRKQLPTEPHRAELLSAALPLPLQEAIEYVHASDRQSAYWRRSRERRDIRQLSDAELRRNYALHKLGEEIRGTEGTVQTDDGREIPTSAAKIGERMADRSFHEEDDHDQHSAEKGRSLLEQIQRWL